MFSLLLAYKHEYVKNLNLLLGNNILRGMFKTQFLSKEENTANVAASDHLHIPRDILSSIYRFLFHQIMSVRT